MIRRTMRNYIDKQRRPMGAHMSSMILNDFEIKFAANEQFREMDLPLHEVSLMKTSSTPKRRRGTHAPSPHIPNTTGENSSVFSGHTESKENSIDEMSQDISSPLHKIPTNKRRHAMETAGEKHTTPFSSKTTGEGVFAVSGHTETKENSISETFGDINLPPKRARQRESPAFFATDRNVPTSGSRLSLNGLHEVAHEHIHSARNQPKATSMFNNLPKREKKEIQIPKEVYRN